jgi:hypothetical protein
MTADHRGESGQQRTVAELLKQYGAEDPAKSGRRRRRAADADDEPPTPNSDNVPVAPAVLADPPTGGYRVNGTGGFDSVSGQAPAPGYDHGYDQAPGPSYGHPEPLSAFDPASGTGGSGAPDPGPPTLSGGGGFSTQPYRADIYQVGGGSPGLPSGGQSRGGESTDFIPRYGERPAGAPMHPSADDSGPSTVISSRAEMFDALLEDDRAGPDTAISSRAQLFHEDDDRAGPGTAISSRAELFDTGGGAEGEGADQDGPDSAKEEPDPPSGFLGKRLRRGRAAKSRGEKPAAEPAEDDRISLGAATVAPATEAEDVPAGLAPEDDAEAVERAGRSSGLWVWLVLLGQLVLGAVLGGALWVGFRYLWLNHQVLALAASVLTTAGLVLLVRAIRRSDDVQTTMLAVLVGLVVTISPAVLLLAYR